MSTPASPLSAAAAAAGATAELANAEKKFPTSMARKVGIETKIPERNYVPMEKLPDKMKKSDTDGIGEGLKWNAEQKKAVPKYHEGGKIKHDGKQVIDAEQGETVLPKKDVKKAAELAMEHLEGMKAGMEKGDKKKKKVAKKSESKSEKSGHKRLHHIELHPSKSGGHIAIHKHESPMAGVSAAPDEMHAIPEGGMDDHLSQNPMQPEPAPDALAGAGPAAGAPAA